VAAEVVIRNSGARPDSIVTVTRDVAGDKRAQTPQREAAETSGRVHVARSQTGHNEDRPQRCLKLTTGAALKEPLLEKNRHGESMRRVVGCGSAIAAPVPCWAVRTAHNGSPAPLRLKVDPLHASLTLRATRIAIVGILRHRRVRSSFSNRRHCKITRGRRAKQLTALGDVTLAMTAGIATKPTRLRVALRKNVQTPPPHELSARNVIQARRVDTSIPNTSWIVFNFVLLQKAQILVFERVASIMCHLILNIP
jgi:hypothetical protein